MGLLKAGLSLRRPEFRMVSPLSWKAVVPRKGRRRRGWLLRKLHCTTNAFAFQVHINLGAGESELSSPAGLALNDNQWHEIRLKRQDADMELTVDRVHNER